MSPGAEATVEKILDGHRKAFVTIDRAVDLLEVCYVEATPADKEVFFDYLQQIFVWEEMPKDFNTPGCRVHALILRSFAKFGPVEKIPQMAFSLLLSGKHDPSAWIEFVGHEVRYSLTNFSERFDWNTLRDLQARCVVVGFCNENTKGERLSAAVSEHLRDTERTIEEIEFRRFEAKLKKNGTNEDPSELLPAEIARALVTAEELLKAEGEFDAKQAGDLLRTSIDEFHRWVVSQVQKLAGGAPEQPDKDGSRRAYMKAVGFISQAEEELFSGLYTFISKEATHKLVAPRETVLFVHRTVTNYLLLLARRLQLWKPATM